MTLSHLSRVVSRLERAGWVRRIPDPTDGRCTLARLTDEGWRKVAAAVPGRDSRLPHGPVHVVPAVGRVSFVSALGSGQSGG